MKHTRTWRVLGLMLALLTALVLTAPPMTRADFAKALATITPGVQADVVKARLGAPDDVVTQGISAARTTTIWRWGTAGRGTFAARGAVHLMANGEVQYVFGGEGTPLDMPERDLVPLLRLLDQVASYNDVLDPGAIVRAVNALVPLGKDRALAVIDEYLRVSSWLDDPGREGVFFVLRMLFEVPAGGAMPHMYVGAPTVQPPTDPTAVPRFPLIVVNDVPLTLVRGYTLAGHPEQPESHVAWFRANGTIRTKALAPKPDAAALEAFIAEGAPLARAVKLTDDVRQYLREQF